MHRTPEQVTITDGRLRKRQTQPVTVEQPATESQRHRR